MALIVSHAAPVAFALFVALSSASSAATNSVYVIESVDWTGTRAYAAVPLEQYQRMRDEAVLRNRCIPKALEAAKKAWRAKHKSVSQAFPPDVAQAESVTSLGLFVSEAAAQDQLADINAREEQRREADANTLSSIEKQIESLKDNISRLRSASRYSIKDRIFNVNVNRLSLKLLERKLAQAKKKQVKQAAALSEARAIFEKNLVALLDSAAPKKSAPAAAVEAVR